MEERFYVLHLICKRLETPCISTSIAYYKRVLYVFNLCVYDEVGRKANMFTWSENIASRGANEIGSCLLKFLKAEVKYETKKIILYSDKCGGQNRNIKLTMLLKKFLSNSPNLREIQQKYFISGHSYNSCDRSFGTIEKQKKVTENIVVPDHWINLISRAKKKDPKFNVIKMKTEDFVSSENLTALIVNRKKTIFNEKIRWLDIDTILYKKCDPFVLYMKRMQKEDLDVINLQKKDVTQLAFVRSKLDQLYEGEREIKKIKYDDLISLLQIIPEEHHEFFINLKYSNDQDTTDYGYANASDEEED